MQNCDVTTGPRQDGITELRLTFDVDLRDDETDPVALLEHFATFKCPPDVLGGYVAYSGGSTISAEITGATLVLGFSPGLENAQTYKVRINTSVTRVAGQTFEVRCLRGDVTSDARVDATDRSAVVGVWTGSGYSPATDINLDGLTDGVDRSIVVGVWTGGANCAP